MGEGELCVHLPESGLSVTRDASTRSILCEWSWRATFLARLPLHGLLGLLHSLWWRRALLLLDAVAVVFLGELALLIRVVLECHLA
jgi:hypothetical protein